ncbi:MAG: DUF2569 family protein [Nanoarchaeota archaeon]|nr:DUF2569 family protein [Nanoarchaeota archaeon]
MVKTKKANKIQSKLSIWFIIILIVLILAEITAAYLLIQRLWILIFYTSAIQWGAGVSMFILAFYNLFLVYSIYLIFRKRKKAINITITAAIFSIIFNLWYYVIGNYIIYHQIDYLPFTIDLIISTIIICYFIKSERVKKTFTR